jgi:hypothetical protein
VDPWVAYGGNASHYGPQNDPMAGNKIGGISVFGGRWRFTTARGTLVGAIGLCGDTSCTDHTVVWKVRHARNFDDVPAGVGALNTDNILFDISEDAHGQRVSRGFVHPACGQPARL